MTNALENSFASLKLQRDCFGFGHEFGGKQAPARRGGEKRSMKRRAGAFVSNHYYRTYVRYLRAIRTS